MSTIAPGELTASAVIDLIESGSYPRDVVLTIARGFLPLDQEDLVAVLAYLGASGDPEVSSTARTALSDVPSRIVAAFAANENVDPVHLKRLLGIATDPLVLETLIRNRVVSDAAVAALAVRAEPNIQEVIVINHARILRAPEILDALLANPSLAPEARRRALETREEFFDKKARLLQEEPEVIDLPLGPIADLLEKAKELEAEGVPAVPAPTLNENERERMKASVVWARLAYMSVSEKVQLAFKGDRMLRMLLVRERIRLIAAAVIRNPRLTEQEIESIAGMRNVDEEVLRMIGTRRDWISKYNLMIIICRNPKAPVGVVLPLINRLTLRDLKGLKDDKGVPQVVRETAKRVYLARTQKTG
jgi:hypothetical protein